MKEFNFERCWREDCKPAFERLAGNGVQPAGGIYGLFCELEELAPVLTQNKKNLSVVEPLKIATNREREKFSKLELAFDNIASELLAECSELVYWSGHLAPSKEPLGKRLQAYGLYWKFQSVVVASIIRRNCGEALHQARQRHTAAHKKFYDHKEGTEFDNEELTEKYKDIGGDAFEVLKVENINYRVEGNSHVSSHPFMIGIKHMKANSISLDLTESCAFPGCGCKIEDHVSDRVVCLKLRRSIKKTDAPPLLEQMAKKFEEDKIKFDGFAFVKADGFQFLD